MAQQLSGSACETLTATCPLVSFTCSRPDHFKCDKTQGWMGNVNNEQRQWFYALGGTIIP